MSSEFGIQIDERTYLAKELTATEKELRDWFVKEYLFDHNPVKAAMRVGFVEPFATEMAKKFMNEAYTQQQIKALQVSEEEDEEGAAIQRKKQIINSLVREANYHGEDSSHGARVSALGKLVSIEGLEAPKKSEIDVTQTSKILLIPAISSIEDWESQALTSQEALINASRVDE